MGKYITLQDVIDTYKRLKDFLNQGYITENQINIWITEAESVIDAKLSKRYTLPLSFVPDIIKTLALELTEYFSEKELHTPTSSGDEVRWLYPRYDRIMEILDQISQGNLILVDSDGNPLEISKVKLNILTSNHLNIKQIFSMKDFEELEIDENYGRDE
ncbi:MAG TPA: DUF1320 family protein [Defluviitoga tunisiensis]|nr:DUF1320 family protein [bacterium]HPP10246.1 DUF1320 family protein [Defluviitoga tunisiensis]